MDPQTKVLSRRTVGLRSWTILRTMNEGSMRDNRGRHYLTVIAHQTDSLQLFANFIAYDYRRFSILSFLLNQPVSRSSTDFLIHHYTIPITFAYVLRTSPNPDPAKHISYSSCMILWLPSCSTATVLNNDHINCFLWPRGLCLKARSQAPPDHRWLWLIASDYWGKSTHFFSLRSIARL